MRGRGIGRPYPRLLTSWCIFSDRAVGTQAEPLFGSQADLSGERSHSRFFGSEKRIRWNHIGSIRLSSKLLHFLGLLFSHWSHQPFAEQHIADRQDDRPDEQPDEPVSDDSAD